METFKQRKVIVIVGPSASGKSAVALELAKKVRGEIVNADSRQIYKMLDGGTSKPTLEERQVAPHHLYDFLDPSQMYNAGEYCKQAKNIIRQIFLRNHLPIVVGGTGLYIRALFDGLAPLPAKDDLLREKLIQIARKNGKKYLHTKLATVDPISAEKIPFQNIQRIVRALEVYKLTKKPLSYWHKQSPKGKTPSQPQFFGLLWDKTNLKERIIQRTKNIVPFIISETEQLLKQGFDISHPGMQSLGYKSAVQFIHKKISHEELYNSVLKDTLHYAKRQRTWFNRDQRINWITIQKPFHPEEIAAQIVSSL